MSQSKKALSDGYVENVKNRIKKVLVKSFGSKNDISIQWTAKATDAIKNRKTFVQEVEIKSKKYSVRIHFNDSDPYQLTFLNSSFEPIVISPAPNNNGAEKKTPEIEEQEKQPAEEEVPQVDINEFVWHSDPEEMLDMMFGFQRIDLPKELIIDPSILAEKEMLK